MSVGVRLRVSLRGHNSLCGFTGGSTFVPHQTPRMLHPQWRTGYRTSGKDWRQKKVCLHDTYGSSPRLLLFFRRFKKSSIDDCNEKGSGGRYVSAQISNSTTSVKYWYKKYSTVCTERVPSSRLRFSPLSAGVEQGTLLSCVNDIAAAVQYTVASHLAKRTHRAILFCKTRGLLPSPRPTLVSQRLTPESVSSPDPHIYMCVCVYMYIQYIYLYVHLYIRIYI